MRLLRALAAPLLGLGALACAGAPAGPAPSSRPAAALAADGLPGVAVDGAQLDPHAFAAEAAFLFPDEARALAHALLRAEFARREATRLGLEPSPSALQEALAAATASLRAQAPDSDLEALARARWGRSWPLVEAALRTRLADNLRFQLCARAWSLQLGRVRWRTLSTTELETAQAWQRRLGNGASAAALVEASLDAGPAGDGRTPWLPAQLPDHELAAGGVRPADWQPGAVWGPWRFSGEAVWRVMQLSERAEPLSSQPPQSILLEQLRAEPVSPLEERAWFSAMASRYNAREGLPAFEPPAEAFVRPRSL